MYFNWLADTVVNFFNLMKFYSFFFHVQRDSEEIYKSSFKGALKLHYHCRHFTFQFHCSISLTTNYIDFCIIYLSFLLLLFLCLFLHFFWNFLPPFDLYFLEVNIFLFWNSLSLCHNGHPSF